MPDRLTDTRTRGLAPAASPRICTRNVSGSGDAPGGPVKVAVVGRFTFVTNLLTIWQASSPEDGKMALLCRINSMTGLSGQVVGHSVVVPVQVPVGSAPEPGRLDGVQPVRHIGCIPPATIDSRKKIGHRVYFSGVASTPSIFMKNVDATPCVRFGIVMNN